MSNCCSCRKYLKVDVDVWYCELCNGEHHPECSGENDDEGTESEFSICKRCLIKDSKLRFANAKNGGKDE